MLLSPSYRRRRFSFFSFLTLFAYLACRRRSNPHPVSISLTRQIVDRENVHGGRWYIPPTWTEAENNTRCVDTSKNVLDAAECALALALANRAFINNSLIPLIVHQTWRSLATETWPRPVQECVEQWVSFATGQPSGRDQKNMAWFIWDDNGVYSFIAKYEADFHPLFTSLPYPVEKSDVFRVLVLKWFGGIYGDVDSKPIKHPYSWIDSNNLDKWIDTDRNEHVLRTPTAPAFTVPITAPSTYQEQFELTQALQFRKEAAVTALFGIEADNLPEPDPMYWRMGYTYPVQLCNWAFGMSPHHPIADQFLAKVTSAIDTNITTLLSIDPLDITGPPALTQAVGETVHQENPSFEWQSLSARNGDAKGGIAKIVRGDTLILPITGFSPGRGWLFNMGSEPVTHPHARLKHLAMSSWRVMDLKVHIGKFCRIAFGMCRDWKKTPDTEF